jgi:hypothetical protein
VSAVRQAVDQPPEQELYARLLEWGTRVGLLTMVLGFGASVFGWLKPQLPLERWPEFWSQPVASYLSLTHAPAGPAWIAILHRGDFGGLAGVAILAGCSLPGLLALVPLYLRRGDKVYAALCLAEIAVMLLAASGWLWTGP